MQIGWEVFAFVINWYFYHHHPHEKTKIQSLFLLKILNFKSFKNLSCLFLYFFFFIKNKTPEQRILSLDFSFSRYTSQANLLSCCIERTLQFQSFCLTVGQLCGHIRAGLWQKCAGAKELPQEEAKSQASTCLQFFAYSENYIFWIWGFFFFSLQNWVCIFFHYKNTVITV